MNKKYYYNYQWPMFLYDPPSIPPSQGGRLKAHTFTASEVRSTEYILALF